MCGVSVSPGGMRRPSASYGTRARDAGHLGDVEGTGPRPRMSTTRVRMGSDLPNMRRVILPSCSVCWRLMHTVPSAPPSPSAMYGRGMRERRAVDVATWSALSPPREVPMTRTRSAVSASCCIHGYARSCRSPLYLTTGLPGSNHEPWISLMRSCGYPAFCGNPSWFCCTHEWIKPACPSSARAWWVGVGWAPAGCRGVEW